MNTTVKRLYGPLAAAGIAVLAATALLSPPSVGAEEAFDIPAPTLDPADQSGAFKTAIFAGGCFWGVQAVFQHTEGVENAVSGYSGGTVENPSYEQVTTGKTGHAEAVAIRYDPREVSYGKLLQIFFSVAHDPTQLDRQGPDIGTQYRSAIYTTTDEQKRVAEAYIAELAAAKAYDGKIVTEVEPLDKFYQAENYHQDYATLHPTQPYIAYYDLPKIENMKTMFPDFWRAEPKLVLASSKSG